MEKGILYIMSTAVSGVIKIGISQTNKYEERMRELQKNGYANVTGLKRQFAMEVNDYKEKENLLKKIFNSNRIALSELYLMNLEYAIQLLSCFEGKIIYPLENKEKIFKNMANIIKEEEKEKEELSLDRHHFKEIDFTASITKKKYHGSTGEDGTLKIVEVDTDIEIPNNNKPSKKEILGSALKDLGEKVDKDETTYQRYRRLMKLVK